MKMKKTERIGGLSHKTLIEHVESCKTQFSNVEDMVNYLQQNYFQYRRKKHQVLTWHVHKLLKASNKNKRPKTEISMSPQKNQKRRIDESESSTMSMALLDEEENGCSAEKFHDVMQSRLRQGYMQLKYEKDKNKNVEYDVDAADHTKTDNKTCVTTRCGGGGVEVKGPMFRDIGGMKSVLKSLERDVMLPFYHPHVLQRIGVKPIGGILLHGPPGCGKTKLAHAIANEMGFPFYKISATELVSGSSGDSEENIRELFSKAYKTTPSIIFIDEIDAIATKRENLQRETDRRIVTQLMTCMDEYHKLVQPAYANLNLETSNYRPGNVLVIGATNRPDAIDPALRRPGRFDREIMLGVPDENARAEILSVLTRKCTLEGSLDIMQIASSTPGFVGADLDALVHKAGNLAVERIALQRESDLSREYADNENTQQWWKIPWLPVEIEKLAITMADFKEAAKMIQPSSRREGFSSIPNVKWEDVGGLDYIRKEFEFYIVRRIKYPKLYQKFGMKNLETGILLYGPPGCGKTLVAKAVANEAGANFIHIKGPELFSKYFGDSEQAIRTLFHRARTCSPCVIFFDEVDSLAMNRGGEGGWVVDRILNQLLLELDQRPGVYVIGATNRPEVMDPAVLRPGRFGKILYVPLPSPNERGLILKALAKGNTAIDASVDLSAIGQMEACENFSGADLNKLMEEATKAALREAISENCSDESHETACTIKTAHFEQALAEITPSVSAKQIQFYQTWSKQFKTT